IDICTGAGIAFIPWYPLAAGRLATPNSRLVRIVRSHGATPSQIALAWLLLRSPTMLPILGTSSVAHLKENFASASIRLSSDEFHALASRSSARPSPPLRSAVGQLDESSSCPGTEGSHPAPSSGESANFQSLSGGSG